MIHEDEVHIVRLDILHRFRAGKRSIHNHPVSSQDLFGYGQIHKLIIYHQRSDIPGVKLSFGGFSVFPAQVYECGIGEPVKGFPDQRDL